MNEIVKNQEFGMFPLLLSLIKKSTVDLKVYLAQKNNDAQVRKVRLIPVLVFLFFSLIISQVKSKTINFSGITWTVKTGNGRGPGPNDWSDNANNIWVDANGRLHMTIKKVGGVWYSTEIYTPGFGYGEYKLHLSSNVDKFDLNTVVGFFTYENDNREIDIEFARWGSKTYGPGSYSVQAVVGGKIGTHSFPLTTVSDGVPTTHKFIWTSDNVNFQSFLGNNTNISPFQDWTYKGVNNPPAGAENFHINFWLFQGRAPSDDKDVELIIDSISIANSLYKQTLSPSHARWKAGNSAWKKSGESLYLKAGTHIVIFEDIVGYNTPANKTITVVKKQTLAETTVYSSNTGQEDSTAVNVPATINFETVGHNWDWFYFARGAAQDQTAFSSVAPNPLTNGINTSSACAKLVVTNDAARWAGVNSETIGRFTLDATNCIIKVLVHKDVLSNFQVGFKVNPVDDDADVVGVSNTTTNAWEELTFDFSAYIGKTYSYIEFIPDFAAGTRNYASTNYWDHIAFGSNKSTGLSLNQSVNLEFFPNPYSNILNIKTDAEIANITIYNFTGQAVKRMHPINSQCSFDASDLSAGSYVVKVEMKDGNRFIQKVVKL